MSQLLTVKTPGLSPAQKYALARLVTLSKNKRAIHYSISELSGKIGVKQHVVRSVISGYLVPKECLTKHVESASHLPGQSRRGRPNYHYKYTDGFDGFFERGVVSGSTDYHKKLTEKLMATRCSEELGPEETVLLAVLLRFADMSGAIRTLGFSDLRGLVGASRGKALAMLETLKSNELLLARIPGGTSPGLFGRVESLYILDIENLYAKMGVGESSRLYRVRRYAACYPAAEIVVRSVRLLEKIDRLSLENTKIRRLGSRESSDQFSGQKMRKMILKNEENISLLEHHVGYLLVIDIDKNPVCNPLTLPASKTSMNLLRRKVSDYARALLLEGRNTEGEFVWGDYELIRERIEADIENVDMQSDKTKEKVLNFIYWASVIEADTIFVFSRRIDPVTKKLEDHDQTLASRFDAITIFPDSDDSGCTQVIVSQAK